TWPEDQDGERAADLQLFAELFGERRDRRQTRIAVVQTRPLLLPLAAEGNKLALASFSCHVSVVVEDSITSPSLARDLVHATGSWLVPVVQRRQTHGDSQRRPAGSAVTDSTTSLVSSLRCGSRGVRLHKQRRRSLRDRRCEIF